MTFHLTIRWRKLSDKFAIRKIVMWIICVCAWVQMNIIFFVSRYRRTHVRSVKWEDWKSQDHSSILSIIGFKNAAPKERGTRLFRHCKRCKTSIYHRYNRNYFRALRIIYIYCLFIERYFKMAHYRTHNLCNECLTCVKIPLTDEPDYEYRWDLT